MSETAKSWCQAPGRVSDRHVRRTHRARRRHRTARTATSRCQAPRRVSNGRVASRRWSCTDLEDVALPGLEPDEVAAERPAVAIAAHEVRDREGGWKTERDGDHAQTLARLRRIDVDDADHIVLQVRDEPVVLRLEPAQVLDALERRLGAPDRVQPRDERQQRAVEPAVLRLVLLRVEVLLRSLE